MASRKIIHLDMDCFYAAVETKHRPELKGRPIGVGGPPQSRSVLCTANYEARKFGVRAAMPSSQAVRLCPNLVLVPPNFPLYKKESQSVRQILEEYTPLIEPLSLDEAYLDVSESSLFGGSATLIAEDMRRRIRADLGLTASAGVAPNKFLAKIASDWHKPDGLFVIRPTDIDDFVKPLKVEKIFGVGRVTAQKMHGLGMHTCADIQQHSPLQMQKWFGSRGGELIDFAFGRDEREVIAHAERKSLTVEETFARDLPTLDEWRAELSELYFAWHQRMERAKGAPADGIRGCVLKVKYFDFKINTHEMACARLPTAEDYRTLLERAWQKRPEPIRLLGIGVRFACASDLLPSNQLELF